MTALSARGDFPGDFPDLTGEAVPGCPAADPSGGFLCTRREGHSGRHAAGTGRSIVAVWSTPSPRAGDTTRRGTESDALGRVSEPRRERVEPLPAPRSGAVGEA